MVDDAEARAFADSIGFDEWPAGHFEKTLTGLVTCWRRDNAWLIRAIVRDDLPAEARARFEEWSTWLSAPTIPRRMAGSEGAR